MLKECVKAFITRSPVVFIAIIMILTSCKSTPEDHNELEEKELKECFLNCDTVEVGKSRGCGEAYFKLIDEKYILKITPHTVLRFDSCQTINLDTINGPEWAHLLLYSDPKIIMEMPCINSDNGTANLPSTNIPAISGSLVIEHVHETIAGKKGQYTTILIKHLFFQDPKSDEIIEVKNELIWKVLDKEVF